MHSKNLFFFFPIYQEQEENDWNIQTIIFTIWLVVVINSKQMTSQELALQSWKEDKANHIKKAQKIIIQFSESLRVIPSSSFESKLQELKEYLRYNYTYQEEENFLQVYTYLIYGNKNISCMELGRKLTDEIGGNIKFWQTKITDIGIYVFYHAELSIWEINSFYERYMYLAPELQSHLRKKKIIVKRYLGHLSSLCRGIDKCKPVKEDLFKIDEVFRKVRKAQEQYNALLSEFEVNRASCHLNSKTSVGTKNNLLNFLKPKEAKFNTLMNYNFKCRRSNIKQQENTMSAEQYQEFDRILIRLNKQRKSQRFGYSSRQQESRTREQTPSIHILRKEFQDKYSPKQIKQKSQQKVNITFIWSKQFFFTFWGYSTKYNFSINFSNPYIKYEPVNYEIDSEQQFDELLAQDVDPNDQEESLDSEQNQNSFVVSDGYQSQREEESKMKLLSDKYFQERWAKNGAELTSYKMYGFEPWPLPMYDEDYYCEDLLDKMNGKTRNQIISVLQSENNILSKQKLENLLKNNFKKARSKEKKVIYLKVSKSSVTTGQPEDQSQTYEISINYVSKSKISQVNEVNQSDETMIQSEQIKERGN